VLAPVTIAVLSFRLKASSPGIIAALPSPQDPYR
jgi:hypothetical protein